jgi:hypothetical protein
MPKYTMATATIPATTKVVTMNESGTGGDGCAIAAATASPFKTPELVLSSGSDQASFSDVALSACFSDFAGLPPA